MIALKTIATLLLSLAYFGISTAHAAVADFTRITRALTDVAPPPQSNSEWIAKSMRLNGLPMTLKSFQSRLTPERVCQHFESLKSQSTVETFRVRSGEWLTLAIRSRHELITIQMRATISGSEGTIAVTPRIELARLQVDTTFPRPPSATVVNLQEYDDDGVEAEHISLTSVRSVTTEADAFAQRLRRDDWQIVRDQTAHSVTSARTLEVQKGAQHALLTLMRNATQPGTAIVIVWRKS
jgi:hypothetical protein